MKRQAMIVTIEQLRTLADDLEEEIKDNLEKIWSIRIWNKISN